MGNDYSNSERRVSMTLLPPGGAELVIILVILFIVFGLVGRLVYRDAKSRGSDWAWQWGVGIAFPFLIGFVPGLLGILIYLSVRGERVEPISQEPLVTWGIVLESRYVRHLYSPD